MGGDPDASEEFTLTQPKSIAPPPMPKEWTLSALQTLEWKRFETVCAEYLRMLEFAPKETSIGADGGIDIWVYKPGSDKPVGIVQCKAWRAYRVGVKPVRELFGVMAAEGVSHGKFITTGEFTQAAIDFAQGKKLELISGERFVAAVRGLPPAKQSGLLQLAFQGDFWTPTCPQCGVKMTVRHGHGQWKDFWGCAKYPRCKAKLVYQSDAV